MKAIIAHIYIAWICPFGEGNGRTARLLEFAILVGAGVPTSSVHMLPSHYSLTRTVYYRELERASQSGDILPFLQYAVEGFRDGLSDQMDTVWQQQHDLIWRNLVRDHFGVSGQSGAGMRRQRLVLGLSRSRPVPRSELRKISPQIAEAYASRGDRTLARDLSVLLDSKLIVRTEGGYRANHEVIQAFAMFGAPRAPGAPGAPGNR